MVRPAGFEPATSCSGGKRSIQLSYGRTIPRSLSNLPDANAELFPDHADKCPHGSCPVGVRGGNIDFGRLLDDQDELRWKSRFHNPFGDGCAAPRIAAA